MKKIAFFVLLLTSAITSADAQSMIKARVNDNSPINVAVDGRFFNKRGTSVTVGDLPVGRHMIQIYTIGRGRYGRPTERLLYEGRVTTSYGLVTVVEYNRYTGITQIFQEERVNNTVAPNPTLNNPQMEIPSNENARPKTDDNMPLASPVASPVIVGTLPDTRVEQLKKSVSAKKTDTEKTNMMKDELKNEILITSQISTMMDWLSFESSKVEFAEWAYPLTADREAFKTLLPKLKYKNYQSDLEKFINSKQ